MGLVTRYGFPKGWQPSADSVNAPEDALLRMDNLVFDEQGTRALRLGSSKVNSSALATTDVRSLYTVDIGGTRRRFAQGSGSVYSATAGVYSTIAGGFDASLDVQFASYLGHAFFASGTIKQKYDGTTLRNWGLAAPSAAPTFEQTAAETKDLATGDSGETTWTDEESAAPGAFVAGFDGTANGARQIQAAAATFRGVMSRDLGASTDFTDFSGIDGTDDDVIEFYAKIDDPLNIKSITITIDLGGSTAPTYDRDTMSFTWSTEGIQSFQENIEQQIFNDFTVEGYLAREAAGRFVDREPFALAVRPELSGWHYFSAKRNEFKHVKTNPDRFWDTVRGVRISFQGSGQGTLAIDRLRMLGGQGAPLTGTYVYRYIYVREDTAYNALGVSSPASEEIIVRNQGITVVTTNPTDTQATHIWLYRMGGFLDAFYRVARVPVVAYFAGDHTASWEPDYFSTTLPQFNFTADFEDDFVVASLATFGPANRTSTWEAAEFAGSIGNLNIVDQLSDKDALILNIRLETDNLTPPDDIIGISEDYFTRIFCLTSDGKVHPSRRLNPEGFSAGQQLRVGGPSETPYWIKKSFGGLYVGTSKDIYRISGAGEELPDGTVNFSIEPLNINSPPINSALAWDGNILIYTAEDGPRLFQGDSSTPLRGATDLLWRGYSRHGVSAINLSGGRFRMAIADGVLTIIVPEGTSTTSSTVLYKYNFAQQQWYRHTYAQAWRSIFREPDGTLVAGDNTGFVWHLEDASATGDAGTGIAVDIRTKIDDFGMPFKPKRAESTILRLDTGGTAATLNFHFDGSDISSFSGSPNLSGQNLFSRDLVQKKFRQLQWRLSGAFTTFRFYGYTIQFVEAPESVEVFDSGSIDFATSGIVFVRSVRLKAQTEVSLTVTPYLNGVAQASKTISSIAKEATIYDVSFGRELKSEQPRFVIQAPAGQTFEPYWLECTYRAAGNMSEKKTVRIAA